MQLQGCRDTHANEVVGSFYMEQHVRHIYDIGLYLVKVRGPGPFAPLVPPPINYAID
jgi:hypothetical protein